MPFYKKLFLKPIKYLAEQYRLSREAEKKVAKKFGVVPMPVIGGMAKVPKVVKPLWELIPKEKMPNEILKVINKGEKLTDVEIAKRLFAKGYRATMDEILDGALKLKKVGKFGQTKEILRSVKEFERLGKELGIRITKTIKPRRFFKK